MRVPVLLHTRCRVLLTEDLSDGWEVEGLTVVSPFAAVPEAVE